MNYKSTQSFPKIITLRENSPPVRIHVSEMGYSDVFGGNEDQMKRYTSQVFSKHNHLFRKSNVLIGMLWADPITLAKTLDIFGLSKEEKWEDNLGIYSWVIHNNEHFPKDPISCGEGIIRLGKELEYRKTTKNIEDYLFSFPEQYCFP